MGDLVAFPAPRPSSAPARPGSSRAAPPRAVPPEAEPLWREAVGHELRAERQRKGSTLTDLAERSGVSMQYLSEIERGLKEPSSEILGAVAGALGLRLVDLTARVTRTLGRMSGPVCLAA